MLFNSFTFAIFFLIVYSLYLLSQRHLKLQNRMLLIASYIFYGWWDWRFLGLIWLSTAVDYFCALKVGESEEPRKRHFFLVISICVNLIILGFFKYFNFFEENFIALTNTLGFHFHPTVLHIILPVGVSFYTFQEISYIVDVYRRQIKAVKNFFDYALFVAFFPQLVAGPIIRATDLLPQILRPRTLKLDQFYEGCYLIFWGLFKKVFIADNLALLVNPVFASGGPYNGVSVLLAVYAFAFQIYCDFSGYTDIARGLGKCMGFDIMLNFNLPYFATNPSDFWKRWHISLSTWLRDYLYIPLGGNKKGELMTYRNLALTMLLGGLWHGAKWTFVLWGAYHGLLLILHRLIKPYLETLPKIKSPSLQAIWFIIKVIFFFHLTCIGWLFFRAESFTQITEMLYAVFAQFHIVAKAGLLKSLVFFTLLLVIVQCFQYAKKDLMVVFKTPVITRAFFYVLCFYALMALGATSGQEFIYFQF